MVNGHTTQISNLQATTNLNSSSRYSYLNNSGTNNNLNGLSSYSYLNIGTNNNLQNFRLIRRQLLIHTFITLKIIFFFIKKNQYNIEY